MHGSFYHMIRIGERHGETGHHAVHMAAAKVDVKVHELDFEDSCKKDAAEMQTSIELTHCAASNDNNNCRQFLE